MMTVAPLYNVTAGEETHPDWRPRRDAACRWKLKNALHCKFSCSLYIFAQVCLLCMQAASLKDDRRPRCTSASAYIVAPAPAEQVAAPRPADQHQCGACIPQSQHGSRNLIKLQRPCIMLKAFVKVMGSPCALIMALPDCMLTNAAEDKQSDAALHQARLAEAKVAQGLCKLLHEAALGLAAFLRRAGGAAGPHHEQPQLRPRGWRPARNAPRCRLAAWGCGRYFIYFVSAGQCHNEQLVSGSCKE